MDQLEPNALRELFDDALAELRATRYLGDVGSAPATRYALEGEGKRVRPVLCFLSARAVGGSIDDALRPALAVEMVHTYSLVHDDLPCMDDDALRRGRPTAHLAHGEALALLAGDALLTDAFFLLTATDADSRLPGRAPPPARAAALVRELAMAGGGRGMVEGQALDLFWTARGGATHDDLDGIHRLKTGQLIGAACAMGAVAGGASPNLTTDLREFGMLIGHAFQILDDLLDDHAGTGKSSGKDKQVGKLTYLALMSRDEAATAASALTTRARALIEPLGTPAEPLRRYADALLARRK